MISIDIPVRVYYRDTDAQGVVFHANYLCYWEISRVELLRSIGIICADIGKNEGIGFVIRKINIEYYVPAVLDDLLHVKSSYYKHGRSSLLIKHSISRNNTIICEGDVLLVLVDINTIKPIEIPKKYTDLLKA